MNKPVLNLDQLTVESFATLDTQQTPAVIDTGCVSGCGGPGEIVIGDIVIVGGGC